MATTTPVNQQRQRPKWSIVTQSISEIAKLSLLTSTKKVLLKEGYVFQPPTGEELQRKMKCQTCGQKMKQRDLLRYEHAIDPNYDRISQPERHDCMYHEGNLFKGKWQCCNGHMYAQGCCSNLVHYPPHVDDLADDWKFHESPTPIVIATASSASVTIMQDSAVSSPRGFGRGRGRGAGNRQYVSLQTQLLTPSRAPSTQDAKDIRAAVALDCEMGTPKPGTTFDSVLIRISLVDFFTGESLIDQLVQPTCEMLHYNTKYSGVTFADMRIASRSGQTIRGTDAAREKLLRYVDANTFIVMHGGDNDLRSLRLIHPANRIIDTHILETYHQEVKDKKLKKNLKDVCMRRCGIVVQDAKLQNGRAAGHNSLEDAMACREIVCAWIRDIPNSS